LLASYELQEISWTAQVGLFTGGKSLPTPLSTKHIDPANFYKHQSAQL